MKRGLLVAVAGAAIVVTSLAGCGEDNKSSATTETMETATAGTATATAGASNAKVVVDGQEQNIQGQVACTTTGDTVNIAIGDATTGIGAVLSNTQPPDVMSVGLGNVSGVTLGYGQGVPEGVNQSNAEATKDGNTYKITGTGMGVDPANPLQPVYKSFEMNVTCP